MSWPPASDYQDAIQNPGTCFHDLELKAGKVSVNKIGLPRVASGNFASVYEMQTGSHRWAVRCFLRQAEDQQNRYALLSLYLSRLKVAGLVEFGYQQEGLHVRGKWYPLVKMEWVEGETLTTYVQKNLYHPEVLRNLALQWRGLIDRLRQHQIAHADLQHGNVLVSPQGQLRLVDYDGMYVPTLRGRRSSELGHINYQHPKRSPDDYDERLDNFSALAIYTALMALSVEPGLWKRFDTGENMLFTAQDYRLPAKSVLLEFLHRQPDRSLQTLAETITAACHGSVAQTPEFRTVVEDLTHGPLPERWWQSAQLEPPTARPAAQPAPHISAPLVPPLPAPYAPAPSRPVWATEAESEGPLVPIPVQLHGALKAGVAGQNEAMEDGLTRSRGEAVPGWRSSSCLMVVAVMFGMGMLAEVAYEKMAPPRPNLPAVHRTASNAKTLKSGAKKHPSTQRVQ